MDYKSLKTPEHCLADFCLIPVRPHTPQNPNPTLTAILDRDRVGVSLGPNR